MRWLRSRWTVVALVPVFFLTGFALMSALAGSDDARSSDAAALQETGAFVPEEVENGDEGDPAADESATDDGGIGDGEAGGEPTEPTNGGGQSGGGGGGTGSGGGGGGPKAPPAGIVEVDYHRWPGKFAIENTEMVPEIGQLTVTGQLKYLGGIDCQVGVVEVQGWFFDGRGDRVGKGLWVSTWATGEGGEVPQREPLYLEVIGDATQPVSSAALRVTKVRCL